MGLLFDKFCDWLFDKFDDFFDKLDDMIDWFSDGGFVDSLINMKNKAVDILKNMFYDEIDE